MIGQNFNKIIDNNYYNTDVFRKPDDNLLDERIQKNIGQSNDWLLDNNELRTYCDRIEGIMNANQIWTADRKFATDLKNKLVKHDYMITKKNNESLTRSISESAPSLFKFATVEKLYNNAQAAFSNERHRANLLEAEKNSLKEECEELKKNKTSAYDQIVFYKKKVDDLCITNRNLERENKIISANNELATGTWSQKESELNKSVETLKRKLSTIEGENSRLSKESKKLKKGCNTVFDSNTDLSSKNKQLIERVKIQEDRISALSNFNVNHTKELEKLRAAYEKKNADYEKLLSKWNTVKDTFLKEI